MLALKRFRSHPMMLIGDEPQSYPSCRDIAARDRTKALTNSEKVLVIERFYVFRGQAAKNSVAHVAAHQSGKFASFPGLAAEVMVRAYIEDVFNRISIALGSKLKRRLASGR